MGCCGRGKTISTTAARPSAVPSARPASPTPSFQYIGGSGLTVQGPVSKRLYRFAGPGSIVAIDARDAPSMMRVALLRRV
jgi:hypothetical protein